jgi:opacity protein-like surface antigen
LVASRSGFGQDASYASPVSNPPSIPDQPPGGAPTPGPEPAPNSTSSPLPPGVVSDAAASPKFYTITASLREEYDDNIYTTKSSKVGSFVTEFSPSFLAHFTTPDSDFSIRYTFSLDYYDHRSGSSFDLSHEGLLRYTHNFSDRFSLDLRDQVGYFNEPDLLDAVGTPFRNGSYYSNIANFVFDAQWSPLFGTQTTYSNIAIFYEDQGIATTQNSDENTVAQDFRFAIAPKFNFLFGFIYDNINYFDFDRGYTDYTGDIGLDWQALPSVSFGIRAGGTYTVPAESGVADSVSPYAAVTLGWQLGKRSSLSFSYTHNVVPTDVVNAIGEEADRFSVRFAYDVTQRITLHLEGIETHAEYRSSLLAPGSSPSFSEDDVGVDLGAEYHLSDNFSFEAGYLLSDVSSQENSRDYTRNQVYVGVRGTY